MTEQDKPPLLTPHQLYGAMVGEGEPQTIDLNMGHEVSQAQREADIKWMKGKCYLKAERQLPETYDDWGGESAKAMAEYMLKEVDGVSFKAVKELRD